MLPDETFCAGDKEVTFTVGERVTVAGMETSASGDGERERVSRIGETGMETSAEGEGEAVRAPLTGAAGMETSAV